MLLDLKMATYVFQTGKRQRDLASDSGAQCKRRYTVLSRILHHWDQVSSAEVQQAVSARQSHETTMYVVLSNLRNESGEMESTYSRLLSLTLTSVGVEKSGR